MASTTLLCHLCQRNLDRVSSHVLTRRLVTRLRSHPSFQSADLIEGARLCCYHFERHDNCEPEVDLVPREYVGHFQDIEQVGRRKRNAKRARDEVLDAPGGDELQPGDGPIKVAKGLLGSWVSGLVAFGKSIMSQEWSSKFGFGSSIAGRNEVAMNPPEHVWVGHVAEDENRMRDRLLGQLVQENALLKEAGRNLNRQNVALQGRIEVLTQANEQVNRRCEELTQEKEGASGFDCFWSQKESLSAAARADGEGSKAQEKFEVFMLNWTGLRDGEKVVERFAMEIPIAGTGRRSRYSPEQWASMFLIYLRIGMTVKWMASYARIGETSVKEVFTTLRKRLQDFARQNFTLPSIEQWKQSTPDDFKAEFPNTLPLFVDGTVIPIYKPGNNTAQKKAYNVKHGIHSLAFSILVTANGRIVWLSQIDLGNQHDATAWNASNACDCLIESYSNIATEFPKTDDAPQLIIGGDKAYPRIIIPGGWKVVVTKTAKDHAVQNIQFVAHGLPPGPTNNRNALRSHCADASSSVISGTIAQWRSVVERTFAVIKNWKILGCKSSTSAKDKTKSKEIIQIVCALANMSMGFQAGDNIL